MKPIVFDVLGTPAPKGSSRAFVNKKTGRAFVAPGGAKSTEAKIKGWDGAVRDAAAEAIGAPALAGKGEAMPPPFVQVAIAVSIVFRIVRPAGHWMKPTKKRPTVVLDPKASPFPFGKPDIDKLARTTLDAMTGIVFDDDSRIARLELDKVWAISGREGASIRVELREDVFG